MAKDSTIEWCTHSLNIAWGCLRVSAGCKNCYAETLAKRWGINAWGPNKPRRILSEKNWQQPLKWNQLAAAANERHRVFCSSMTDVFLDDPILAIMREKLWPLIEQTPHLDYLILTKRPENIMRMLPKTGFWRDQYGYLPPNVWIGTSMEDQPNAEERLVHLLSVPARVRFISAEPLLAPITDLFASTSRDNHDELLQCKRCGAGVWDSEETCPNCHSGYRLEWLPSDMIHWIIVGGESGGGARPMQEAWARQLRDDCATWGIPFFFKQGGKVLAKQWQASDTKGGKLADIPEDLRIREFPLQDDEY